MQRTRKIIAALLIVIAGCAAVAVHAREIPVPPPAPVKPEPPAYKVPPIEKIGGGLYRLGEVTINKNEKSLSFPAQVNMDQGLLEYLMVYKSGKTHESLLRTDITPYTLQVAFMLLGYEGTDKRLAGQGAQETPKGEQISITVGNVAGKQAAAFPVENWLANRTGETVSDVQPLKWVYCGSYINEYGHFLSQETGSIAAIWHDPVAMIDNASPGGESNRIWFVKQGTVPPVGTPVTVTVKPAK